MDASPLAQLQQRLENHFNALALTRNRSSFPIFALEHDLGEAERQTIRRMLRVRSPSSRFWLLWVVYATEEGYDYEGDEYWGSFEDRTPQWESHHRPRIKTWFRRFQQTYGGVVPSGPWAEQFSIIAWPITHAILPRYLQRQFAKLLYGLRFRLASQITLDARRVGRLLAVNAFGAPARFRAFLEQEELTGQIVGALLGGEAGEGELVHAATLRRIVADLERARNAREWLGETRRVVSDRFKGIGQGSGSASGRAAGSAKDGRPFDTSHLTIRPGLALRHGGGGAWSVFLDVKSFRPVAALSAEIRLFLGRTRCRLNGGSDFKPRGWLLSGDRKGALRSWPDPGSPLIEFERSDPTIDHLLESECRLHPGPVWLFRMGGDGIARHISGGIVRPGIEYIVVTTLRAHDILGGMERCDVECVGVDGYRLRMPTVVSAEMTAELRRLGLQVARTIRVWPAGLPGRGWDGEGSSEWLTTESPCFGIAHDHPIESLAFCLNGESTGVIRTGALESRMFVRVAPLPAGMHTLAVKAERSRELDRLAPTPAAEGFVRLAIREPEPWTPGVTSHVGLIVRADPDDGDLDSFWRNRISLSVNGPKGFGVKFCVTLESADGCQVLSEAVGGAMGLPVSAGAWRRRFEQFLQDETRAWRYLEAASCTLKIDGGTLGARTLRFDHEPVPVRWTIRSRRGDIVVRLVDDSGQEETEPLARLYSIERPLEGVGLGLDQATAGTVVAPPGGLFVASHGQHRDAVFVSTRLEDRGLRGLGVKSEYPGLRRSAQGLSAYFGILGLWRDARVLGFLAGVRHRQVLDGAVVALRAALCGENWVRAERQFGGRLPLEAAVASLAACVDKRGRFGSVVGRGSTEWRTGSQASAWFVDAAARHGVCRDRALSEFALLAAREPLAVVGHPNRELLLGRLANNPIVLRAARLLTLALNAPPGGGRKGASPHGCRA